MAVGIYGASSDTADLIESYNQYVMEVESGLGFADAMQPIINDISFHIFH